MGSIFGDTIIATALLDRLLHHSTTVNIRGESYRLKERRRAGLIAGREQQESEAAGALASASAPPAFVPGQLVSAAVVQEEPCRR